jgi:2-polyprenyl-6-hydroxyphenyl methylase/3-demethylubiquinone-9 3-methyltransferase
MELKRRYYPSDTAWKVENGSLLDTEFVKSLGTFEIVYSWGVVHHTGAMWNALENVATLVASGGRLFISVYNDQGGASRRWAAVKRVYNGSPLPLRWLFLFVFGTFFQTRSVVARLLRFENPLPFKYWAEYKRNRAMSVWRDLVDWVGGYPFEVAKPEDVFDFFRERGFILSRLKTWGGDAGCNEYVFVHAPGSLYSGSKT